MNRFMLILLVVIAAGSSYGAESQSLLDPLGSLLGGYSAMDLVGGLLFGGIGYIAFNYGRKKALWAPVTIGILLMVYPYFISGTVLLYVLGLLLTASLFVVKI